MKEEAAVKVKLPLVVEPSTNSKLISIFGHLVMLIGASFFLYRIAVTSVQLESVFKYVFGFVMVYGIIYSIGGIIHTLFSRLEMSQSGIKVNGVNNGDLIPWSDINQVSLVKRHDSGMSGGYRPKAARTYNNYVRFRIDEPIPWHSGGTLLMLGTLFIMLSTKAIKLIFIFPIYLFSGILK